MENTQEEEAHNGSEILDLKKQQLMEMLILSDRIYKFDSWQTNAGIYLSIVAWKINLPKFSFQQWRLTLER